MARRDGGQHRLTGSLESSRHGGRVTTCEGDGTDAYDQWFHYMRPLLAYLFFANHCEMLDGQPIPPPPGGRIERCRAVHCCVQVPQSTRYGAMRKNCRVPAGICRNGLVAPGTSAHGPATSLAD